MSGWVTHDNLKRIIDQAMCDRADVHFTQEQWHSVLTWQGEQPPVPNYMCGGVVAPLGPAVFVIESVEESTPYKMGLLG